MSENTSGAEVTVLAREDGTMYTEEQFSLAKTSEISQQFKGDHKIPFRLPAAVKGLTVAEFLTDSVGDERPFIQTLRNIAAFVHPEADFGEWLTAKVNGQGLRLDTQKEIKELLRHSREPNDPETITVDGQPVRIVEATVEQMLGAARELGANFVSGAPRTRTGGGSKGKLAAAEAAKAKIGNTAVEMYRGLSRAMRRQYREQLIEMGAATAEQLDEIDAA